MRLYFGKKGTHRIWLAALLLLCCVYRPAEVRAAGALASETIVLRDTAGEGLPQAPEKGTESISVQDVYGSLLPQTGNLRTASAGSDWSYGAQLKGNELSVYQAMQKVQDWRSVTDANPVEVKFSQPYQFTKAEAASYKSSSVYKKMQNDMNRGAHAYLKDYGKHYWLKGVGVSFYTPAAANGYQITGILLYPKEYYQGIKDEVPMTDAALSAACQAVSGTSRYEYVKEAHDYVVQLIAYPAKDDEPYHTITGALLDKYGHIGVCEAYAKLFQLLCQNQGIPCILVTGGSVRDSSGNVISDHMWDYVQMEDGLWYLVDATWDDGGSWKTYTNYLLAGASTMGLKGKTAGNDHIPVGRYESGVTYDPFVMPDLSERSYLENHPEAETAPETLQASSLQISKTSLTLSCRETGTLQAEVLPAGALVTDLVWTSSNAAVATVESSFGESTVTAKKAGEAVITVKSESNPAISAACTVKVSHTPGAWKTVRAATTKKAGLKQRTCTGCGAVTESQTLARITVKLNASSLKLQLGKTTTKLKVQSLTSGDAVKSWTSNKPKVVAVNKKTGKLQAKKTGTAKITVTTKRGAKATCVVTVQKGVVKTTSLAFSKKTLTMKRGKKVNLTLVRKPLTANDKLTYTSSNKKIATVTSAGKVTAKKKGKVKITVRSASGKRATITITVK